MIGVKLLLDSICIEMLEVPIPDFYLVLHRDTYPNQAGHTSVKSAKTRALAF